MTEAVALFNAAGTLKVTGHHYVFVQRGTAAVTPIPARHVRTGDRLLTNRPGEFASVEEVEQIMMQGYHGPLTASGDILADGVLASCYVELGLPHSMMHVAMALWRLPNFPTWLRPQSDASWIAMGEFVKSLTGFTTPVKHVAKRLLLWGATGAGKSSFGNALFRSPIFEVGHNLSSCTSSIRTAAGRFAGSDHDIEVIDMGGVSDSEGRDEELTRQAVSYARSNSGLHALVFVVNACLSRFNRAAQESVQSMLTSLASTEGYEEVWTRTAFVFTQCDDRKHIYQSQLQKELEDRFGLASVVPQFWVGQLPNDFLEIAKSLFQTGWRQEFAQWLNRLPASPYQVPLETSRDRASRQQEEHQRQEQQDKKVQQFKIEQLTVEIQATRAKIDNVNAQAQRYQ
eukprot:TRINITY_DN49154_c0_g1_i1.p1 TRINITY_DN49154_c0_g1~~TRINITY_DN49154_c0_g1_i1.p1  ORF type:complete len:425 (+),score=40.74 TRINITY_DN49154_c0_g1_i1:76-1275(+)